MQISQGKVREKSGKFDILCEWQPCNTDLLVDSQDTSFCISYIDIISKV